MARAGGTSLPISTKHAIMIADFVRHKSVTRAKVMLEAVMKKEQAVPFTRFNSDRGHKPGMAAGQFPIKAASEILKVIKAAEANAQMKGISGDLEIVHIAANRAARPLRYGRKSGVKSKRTHLDVVLAEGTKKEARKERVKKEQKGTS